MAVAGIALGRIPGLQEAIQKARAKQHRQREVAWKGLGFNLLGVHLRTMTVSDYVILDHYGSPFINRQVPEMADLAFFCWALSRERVAWDSRRFQFGRSFEAFCYARKIARKFRRDIPENHAGKVCFQEAVTQAFQYVEDMFLDAPPGCDGSPSGLCYLASWFDAIQSEHKIDEPAILAMPLPQLFQRLKAIRLRKGDKVPSFDRFEDEVKAWVQKGIAGNKFTYEDLAAGRVKFGEN